MLNRTYAMQEEIILQEHKPMKDVFTLLLYANTSVDLNIKLVMMYHFQVPHKFQEQNVNKAGLLVIWRPM